MYDDMPTRYRNACVVTLARNPASRDPHARFRFMVKTFMFLLRSPRNEKTGLIELTISE